MEPNTHSITPPGEQSARPAAQDPAGRPDGLVALTAAVETLAAQDLQGLPDAVRAERVLELWRLLDRLEGHWLAELAAVDAGGAAGADQGSQAGCAGGWPVTGRHKGAGQPPAQQPAPPGPRSLCRWSTLGRCFRPGRGLAARLQAAGAMLPPVLGGALSQPLALGRTTRVVTPPNRPPWPSATAAGSSTGALMVA